MNAKKDFHKNHDRGLRVLLSTEETDNNGGGWGGAVRTGGVGGEKKRKDAEINDFRCGVVQNETEDGL